MVKTLAPRGAKQLGKHGENGDRIKIMKPRHILMGAVGPDDEFWELKRETQGDS